MAFFPPIIGHVSTPERISAHLATFAPVAVSPNEDTGADWPRVGARVDVCLASAHTGAHTHESHARTMTHLSSAADAQRLRSVLMCDQHRLDWTERGVTLPAPCEFSGHFRGHFGGTGFAEPRHMTHTFTALRQGDYVVAARKIPTVHGPVPPGTLGMVLYPVTGSFQDPLVVVAWHSGDQTTAFEEQVVSVEVVMAHGVLYYGVNRS